MGRSTWISLGIFIAVLAVGAFFLTRQDVTVPETNEQRTESPAMTEEETEEPEGSMEEEAMEEEEEVMEISVEADEFSFSPDTLSVEAGTTVRMTVENVGSMQHDLVFEGLDIATQRLAPGESETIEFTLDESGTYTFYCSVSGHRALGMEGELTVE